MRELQQVDFQLMRGPHALVQTLEQRLCGMFRRLGSGAADEECYISAEQWAQSWSSVSDVMSLVNVPSVSSLIAWAMATTNSKPQTGR